MPVRIETGDNSTDPRVISLDLFNEGRDNFDMHYYYTSAQAAFGGQVVDATWQQFSDAVLEYVNQTGVDITEVALRFVHCLEQLPDSKLYLRLQICKMVPSGEPAPPGALEVFNLDTAGSLWYEIKDGNISPTSDETLIGDIYFDHMYYKVEPQAAEMQRLRDDTTKYVRNLVLPWADEILQMYMQNQTPADAGIHFGACSFETPPERSNVLWPHGIVVYLSDSTGQPLLNNDSYISIFRNKGADMATLCPPKCGVYIKPDLAPASE